MKADNQYHKLRTAQPNEIIDFVDQEYPSLRGMCYYDTEERELASTNKDVAGFHYDPFHGVLCVTIKDTKQFIKTVSEFHSPQIMEVPVYHPVQLRIKDFV